MKFRFQEHFKFLPRMASAGAAFFFFFLLFHSAGENPLNGDTSPTPLSYVLEDAKPGDVIRLDSGTFTGGVVIPFNITLEGTGGTKVISPSPEESNVTSGVGVRIKGNNVTLRGLIFVGAEKNTNIVVEGNGAVVENVSLEGGAVGISVEGTAENFSGRDIEVYSADTGIYLSGEGGVKIEGYIQNGGKYGIKISEPNVILGNVSIKNTSAAGIWVTSPYVEIFNAGIRTGKGVGVDVSSTKLNEVRKVRIENLSVSGGPVLGIALDGASDCRIVWNTVEEAQVGISLRFASKINLSYNIITSNERGIECMRCRDNTAFYNEIKDNVIGVRYSGLSFSGDGGLVLSYNNIMDNFAYGVEYIPADDAEAAEGYMVSLQPNYYGSPYGPYPYGPGNALSDGVNAEEWLSEEVATRPELDEIPPAVTIEVFPLRGINSPFTVEGTASDNRGVRNVYVSIDNGCCETAEGTLRWKYTLLPEKIGEGKHLFSVYSSDGRLSSKPAEREFYVFPQKVPSVHLGDKNEYVGSPGSFIAVLSLLAVSLFSAFWIKKEKK